MNKVITINLGGTAFQLEDAGYDALRAYLDTAHARLKNNPDRDEIVSDIEQAIAEKFRAVLASHKNVVLVKEVEAVLAEMGEIEDDSTESAGGTAADSNPSTAGAGAGSSASAATAETMPAGPKRLYRIREGAMISGVCNGIAGYCNIDPTIVRLAFILLVMAWGTGILAYLIMAFVVPEARSPEEKAQARGLPATAQEFIRRAKAGYYEAMKSFPDRHARREWKRNFKREMRDWRRSFHREMEGAYGPRWFRYDPAHPGSALALPIFSLLHGVLIVLWISAIVSLLATQTVLGLALPAGVPVWMAIFVLMFVFGIVAWPLKAARRAAYFHAHGGGPGGSLFYLIDVAIWIGVVVVLLWLARHHLPQAREAIANLPSVVHDAVDTIREWWNR